MKITGESSGVKAGGKLKVKRRTLKVKGMIKDLPEHLTIDITGLEIGQSIKIGDLSYDKLEIIDNKRAMIVCGSCITSGYQEEEGCCRRSCAEAPEAEAAAAE